MTNAEKLTAAAEAICKMVADKAPYFSTSDANKIIKGLVEDKLMKVDCEHHVTREYSEECDICNDCGEIL